MDQANTATYDFISNYMEAEDTSIGDHKPQGFAYANSCGKKASESGFKGAVGTILTGFYSNFSKLSDGEKKSIFNERDQLNINGGWKRKSFDKETEQVCIHHVQKTKRLSRTKRKISSLKSKCE